MANIRKYYWDACIWIALIKREHGRFEACSHVVEEARNKKALIYTSTFTLAEVFKAPCGDSKKFLLEENDKFFENFLDQDFIVKAQVDATVGHTARKILRRYSTIKKPQDAIHLATAMRYNVDELHTFDKKDLLPLNNQIHRFDGELLNICEPPLPPIRDMFQHDPIRQMTSVLEDESKTLN